MQNILHPSLSPDSQILDVRPILEGGKDPFGAIMQALAGLNPGQGLVVHAPFEPKPLFGIMASKGFKGRSLRLNEDDWLAEFLPGVGVVPSGPPTIPTVAPAISATLHLDVRGLEPPEPMVQILAACENLAPGETLEVTHDRRPQMLYPRLDERGLSHVTTEREGGEIHLFITLPPNKSKP